MSPARPVQQLAMDETLVEDIRLEQALEEWQKRRDSLSAVRLAAAQARAAADAEIEKLELPTGAVVRSGRFRIERKYYPGRSVSFDALAKERVRISLVSDDD